MFVKYEEFHTVSSYYHAFFLALSEVCESSFCHYLQRRFRNRCIVDIPFSHKDIVIHRRIS